MTRASGALIFAVLVSILGYPVQAACGGGGFKAAAPVAINASYESHAAVSERSVARPQRESVSTFDTSRFDKITPQLSLNEDQFKQVSKAKRDISERMQKLVKDAEKAQSKLEACDGHCEKEKRKLEESRSKVSDFDARREFEQRLSDILNEKQMQAYKSAS